MVRRTVPGGVDEPRAVDRSLALQVSRDDLRHVRVVETGLVEPGPGEVLFRVERFGVSANNVTYARLGDTLGYWDIFPAGRGWGQIPVWGYLRAVASHRGEVAAGRRAFGLAPMATHVMLRPGRGEAGGFRNTSIHRAAVSGVYSSYFWAEGDHPDRRIGDALAVLRPLFWLSFTVDNHLAESDALTSGVVITSASSKAAIGLGYLLRRRGMAAIGLTSSQHAGFVEGTSAYDRVVAYDQLDALAALGGPRPVLVDVAGRHALREQIGRRMAGRLMSVVVAGLTHRDGNSAPDGGNALFSAPQRIRDLSRRWGWPVLSQRFTRALNEFAESATWLTIETARGIDGAAHVYQQILGNSSPPATGHIVDLG
jgi:Protein of unknown function (DUF2855)